MLIWEISGLRESSEKTACHNRSFSSGQLTVSDVAVDVTLIGPLSDPRLETEMVCADRSGAKVATSNSSRCKAPTVYQVRLRDGPAFRERFIVNDSGFGTGQNLPVRRTWMRSSLLSITAAVSSIDCPSRPAVP